MRLAAANWFEEVKEKKERRETGVKTRDKSFKMKGGEKEMLNATTFHLGSPPPTFFFFFVVVHSSTGLGSHLNSSVCLSTTAAGYYSPLDAVY